MQCVSNICAYVLYDLRIHLNFEILLVTRSGKCISYIDQGEFFFFAILKGVIDAHQIEISTDNVGMKH